MSESHEGASLRALASIQELIAKALAMQVAIMRDAPAEEIEGLRQEAMSMAEAYLDRMDEAARARIRAILG